MWFKLNVDQHFLDIQSTQFKLIFYTTENLNCGQLTYNTANEISSLDGTSSRQYVYKVRLPASPISL